jgi:tetratricopeptide (TPR) repeat protein
MRLAIAAASIFLGACAAVPPAPSPEPYFLDGHFAPPGEKIGADDIFALSDAMRHYLHQDIAHQLHEEGPVLGLIDALNQRGQLKLEYDAGRTRNAAQAFEARKGNCLSLVIMTAALARELRLEVAFQSVESEVTWSRRGGVAYRNGHVNLTLGRRAMDAVPGYDPARLLTVDFLPAHEILGQRTRPVSEQRIVAMYMNNRAAEALDDERLDDAYWWVRAAIKRSPDYTDAYNTLAVIYLHHGDLEQAAHALSYPLGSDPDDRQALSNLLVVREHQGMAPEAEAVRKRLAELEAFPPYHYFFLGIAAMERGDYSVARQMFAEEVNRAGYSGEFHFWLGVAQYRLGDIPAARQQLALALENSVSDREHALYAGKLERLRADSAR